MFPLLHKCRFWQDDRGFFPYQCFLFDWLPLFISPWQQILFYLPFLSISAFASYPPLLFTAMFSPSSALIFLPFWPFFNQTSALFKTFWRFNVIFVFFPTLGCFYSGPQFKTFFDCAATEGFFFFLKRFQCPSSVTLDLYSQNAFFSSKWPPTSSRGRDCELVSC